MSPTELLVGLGCPTLREGAEDGAPPTIFWAAPPGTGGSCIASTSMTQSAPDPVLVPKVTVMPLCVAATILYSELSDSPFPPPPRTCGAIMVNPEPAVSVTELYPSASSPIIMSLG